MPDRLPRPKGIKLLRTVQIVGGALFLGGFAIYSLFPSLWLLATSLKDNKAIFVMPPVWLPWPPTLVHYRSLFAGGISIPLLTSFVNTAVVASLATLLALLVGSPAAYGFARFRYRGSRLLFFLVLVTRMFPVITLAVPLYILIARLGLHDTRTGLVLAYTSLTLPFVIWMMHAFFQDLPRELEEAAMVDGCSRWGALVRIIMPLAAPGLAATAILALIYPWNDLLLGLVLTASAASQTMPVSLSQFNSGFQISWGPLAAGATLFTLPVLVFALAVQRYLVRGLTLGAVKG